MRPTVARLRIFTVFSQFYMNMLKTSMTSAREQIRCLMRELPYFKDCVRILQILDLS